MAKEIYKKELSDKVLGIPFSRQKTCQLYHRGEFVKCYISDIIIDNSIILELKSVKALNRSMESQIINYLKISGIPIGYLINFHSSSVVWRRFINLPSDRSTNGL